MRRERHNLSMLTFPSAPPPRAAPSYKLLVWTSPGRQPSSSEARTQLTAFSQISKILSPCFQCMTSFTPPGRISYLGFYFDICEWRILPAHAWTTVLMLHLTNPCTKRKVLSLTKPKGKIYKTKSLGNCITISVECILFILFSMF